MNAEHLHYAIEAEVKRELDNIPTSRLHGSLTAALVALALADDPCPCGPCYKDDVALGRCENCAVIAAHEDRQALRNRLEAEHD